MTFDRPALSLAVFAIGFALPAWAVTNPVPPAGPHRTALLEQSPDYPELARRMHISGQVVMLINIADDGTVTDVRIESGHMLLRQAALDAVRRWRFAPGPAANLTITVSFHPPAN